MRALALLTVLLAAPGLAASFEGRGFTLDAPPWSQEREPGTDRVFFIAPKGEGALARGVLKVERVGAEYRLPEARRRLKRRLAAGTAFVWDSGESPRTRTAAIRAPGGFVVVAWQAPAACFEGGLPAFDRALETLRFEAKRPTP